MRTQLLMTSLLCIERHIQDAREERRKIRNHGDGWPVLSWLVCAIGMSKSRAVQETDRQKESQDRTKTKTCTCTWANNNTPLLHRPRTFILMATYSCSFFNISS